MELVWTCNLSQSPALNLQHLSPVESQQDHLPLSTKVLQFLQEGHQFLLYHLLFHLLIRDLCSFQFTPGYLWYTLTSLHPWNLRILILVHHNRCLPNPVFRWFYLWSFWQKHLEPCNRHYSTLIYYQSICPTMLAQYALDLLRFMAFHIK